MLVARKSTIEKGDVQNPTTMKTSTTTRVLLTLTGTTLMAMKSTVKPSDKNNDYDNDDKVSKASASPTPKTNKGQLTKSNPKAPNNTVAVIRHSKEEYERFTVERQT